MLPLLRPAMAAFAVLIFTFVWNDYFWALVLVQSDDVRPSPPACSRCGACGRVLALDLGRVAAGGDPAGHHVLPDAAPFHRRPDAWRRGRLGREFKDIDRY